MRPNMRKFIFILSLFATLFIFVMVARGVRSEWTRHHQEGELLSHSFVPDLVSFKSPDAAQP